MTVPAGVHDAFDLVEEQFNEALDESLDPTGPGVLYDYVAAMGLPAGSVALDAPHDRQAQRPRLPAVRARPGLTGADCVGHYCCV